MSDTALERPRPDGDPAAVRRGDAPDDRYAPGTADGDHDPAAPGPTVRRRDR